jgi:hypothetical protein
MSMLADELTTSMRLLSGIAMCTQSGNNGPPDFAHSKARCMVSASCRLSVTLRQWQRKKRLTRPRKTRARLSSWIQIYHVSVTHNIWLTKVSVIV